jgi:hypothetical protein
MENEAYIASISLSLSLSLSCIPEESISSKKQLKKIP